MHRYYDKRYDEAEDLFERSLGIREKVLGLEHPKVAWSLNNLAQTYLVQGRYADAEPLYLRALAIWDKIPGQNHLGVASSLGNLGQLYQARS
jgi:tetratricopeptide (TPR) repeat protein